MGSGLPGSAKSGKDVDLCPEDLGISVSFGPNETIWLPCDCGFSTMTGRVEGAVDIQDYIDSEYSSASLDDGAAINGATIALGGSGPDPANAVHEDVWFSVPPDLADKWSTSFPFDDSTLHWVYAHVGWNFDSACSSVFNTHVPYIYNGAYLVSGLRPYVAYKIMSRSRSRGLYRSYRVRVWVGLMHHFSFFIPPSNYTDWSPRWDTSVLLTYLDDSSRDMWDVPTGRVDARGRFVDMYTSLLDTLRVQVSWDSGASASRLYSCDPNEDFVSTSRYASDTYQDRDGSGNLLGTAAPICYSNPATADPTSGTSYMTAFLGEVAWGDACIFTAARAATPSATQLARKAFQMIFGSHAVVSYELRGQGFNASSPAFQVNRWWRLDSSNLEAVESVIAEQNGIRTTAEDRYVLREWDVGRLEDAAADLSSIVDCACG